MKNWINIALRLIFMIVVIIVVIFPIFFTIQNCFKNLNDIFSYPLYILFAHVRMLDRFVGIILVFISFNIPFAVWLMRSFFEDIAKELEEAALIDGASLLGTFFKVSLPLVKPGIFACAIFTFVMCINEFFFALVLTGSRVKPAAVAMLNFLPTGVRGTLYGQAAVASILIMIPALLLFIFFQKHFVRGLTFGAIKG